MENQEPLEPSFPAGYTLPPEKFYRGSGGGCPAPKPVYPEVSPAVDASTAAASTASAAEAALAARAEAAIQSSGGRGSSGSAGKGVGIWGHRCGGRGEAALGEPRSAPRPWPTTTITLMGGGASSGMREKCGSSPVRRALRASSSLHP